MKEQIENLQKSYELSSEQVADAVNPIEVAAIFEREKVSYVLIGGHMLSYYTGAARATGDVDFIVGGADFSRSVNLVGQAFQQFRRHDRVYHITYDSTQQNTSEAERIDLVKDSFPLFREVVKSYSVSVRNGDVVVQLPIVEAAIALKFAASISPNRGDENKPIDHADLIRLVRYNPNLDKQLLSKLGDLVYVGGGNELLSVVSDLQSGKHVSL